MSHGGRGRRPVVVSVVASTDTTTGNYPADKEPLPPRTTGRPVHAPTTWGSLTGS